MKFFVLRFYFLIIALSPLAFLSAKDGHLDFNPQEEAARLAITIQTLERSDVTELTLNIEVLGLAHDLLDSLPANYLPNLLGLVTPFLNSEAQTVIVPKSEALALFKFCKTLFSGDPAIYMGDSTSMQITALNRLFKILTAAHAGTIHCTAAVRARPEMEAQRLLRAQDYLESLEKVHIYSRTRALAQQIRDNAGFPHNEYGDVSKFLVAISENQISKDDLLSFITFSTEIVDSQRPDYSGERHFNFSPALILSWAQLIQSLHQDIAVQAVARAAGTLRQSPDEKLTTTESMRQLAHLAHRFANYLHSLQDEEGQMRGVKFTVQDADDAIMAVINIKDGEIRNEKLGRALIVLNEILTELYGKTDFNSLHPGTAETLEALTHEIVLEVKRNSPTPAARGVVRIDADELGRAKRLRGPHEARGPDISHFEFDVGSDGALVLSPPNTRDLLPRAIRRALSWSHVDREITPQNLDTDEDPNKKGIVDKALGWLRGRKMPGNNKRAHR